MAVRPEKKNTNLKIVFNSVSLFSHHASEYDSDYGYVYNIISRIESRRPSKIINLNVLEAYLLSTAAKDLSILMSFRRTAG